MKRILITAFCIASCISISRAQVNRLWATYYGGANNDGAYTAVATDAQGNVYMAGFTNSNGLGFNGYQNTGQGGGDGLLVKFDANGNRLWSTYYYGSPGSETATDVAVDPSGNVYLAGYTSSTSGIASGGFQNTYGGGASDLYLVKFDANGNRLWATYYGGTLQESRGSIATDALGNVYLAGETQSSGIASGGHQNTYGGGLWDAILVKFNAAGVRQWATYYGGTVDDIAMAVATDNLNNVYISGTTSSTASIASGGFQNTSNGGGDAFLAKFNSAGNRLWATYYGGNGGENGTSLCTDASQNIYMAGLTTSTNVIGSGGHQNTFGGSTDMFLVKFDANGNRSWSTYYGGSGDENKSVNSLAADPLGNVFLCGGTNSTSGIASGGFQNVFGGGVDDAFLVSFAPNGTRLSATYYGGNGQDVDFENASTAVDPNGNVYLCAATASTANIASGGFQNTIGGASDFFLVKFGTECKPAQPGAISGNTTVCQNNSYTYSVNAVNGATSYTWTLPNGWTGNSTTNSITVNSGSNNGTISVTANNACGASAPRTLNVTVSHPSVSITPNGGAICMGSNITLSANGASSYVWQPGNLTGNSITVSPASTQNYTVTGTDAFNCTAGDTVTVTVNSLPPVQAGSDQVVCAGTPITLFGSSAQNYTWNNGVNNGIPFTPASTNSYIVTGTDGNNCSNTDTVTVTVNTLPDVNAGNNQTVCFGTAVTLSGNGAQNYSWTNGVINGMPFTPVSTNTYILTGTDGNNCSDTDTVTVFVNALPSVSAGNDQAVCAGASVTLSGSGAQSYTWDNGVTDNLPFTANITNTYIVTGTDVNNCSNTDTVTVTVNNLPNVSAGNDQAVCEGTPVTLSGSGAQNYSWNNGVTDNVPFTPNITNSYIVTGTDGNNCSHTDTVMVTVHPLPQVNAGNDQVICEGDSVTLSGSGAQNYTWDNGVSNGIPFIPVFTNSYIVMGTDGNNCSGTDTITVTVNPLPNVIFNYTGPTGLCLNDGNQTLNGGSPAGGIYTGPGVTGNIFNPNVAGVGSHTIVYTFTDNNNCAAETSIVLTVSGCFGMEGAETNTISVKAYPNPGTEKMVLQLSGTAQKEISVTAFTIEGKTIHRDMYAWQPEILVNTNDWPSGIYIVQVGNQVLRWVKF